ncbi:MAG TPA: HEAT repeat domain-containing protein, partial [Polyangiaceae bacterium]|nr:HEAT repeat domain-containing protein [Polyangiaceae bacterium]
MLRPHHLAAGLSFSLLVACGGGATDTGAASSSAAPAAPAASVGDASAPDSSDAPALPVATAWRTTADIFPSHYDDELRGLVDGLAALPRVTGSHVTGDSPARGRVWRIRTRASENQLFALAFHESPIVRAYFAPSAIGSMPARYRELAPLLRDGTTVETFDYDIGGTATIASLALDAFLELPSSREIDDLLEAALDDDHVDPLVRMRAFEPWAERHRAAARDVARRWLASSSPVLLRAAIGMLGRVRDGASQAAIASLSDHADPFVRGEVATAMSLSRREEAEPVVRGLALTDPD